MIHTMDRWHPEHPLLYVAVPGVCILAPEIKQISIHAWKSGTYRAAP